MTESLSLGHVERAGTATQQHDNDLLPLIVTQAALSNHP